MKELTLKINSENEIELIQKSVFAAGGSWHDGTQTIKKKNIKFFNITEDLKLTCSNDPRFLAAREQHLLPVSEALILLESLVEKLPFLNRSGIKKKPPFMIDSYIIDQFITVCRHRGLDPNRRIENLIAADIKASIHKHDVIEHLKRTFDN